MGKPLDLILTIFWSIVIVTTFITVCRRVTEDWLWPRSTTLLPHLLRWCSGSILSFYSVKTVDTCPSLTCVAFNNFPRSAMPDVTNNLVRKPHSSDTGSCCILEADDKIVKAIWDWPSSSPLDHRSCINAETPRPRTGPGITPQDRLSDGHLR